MPIFNEIDTTFYTYCAKDSLVTFEINDYLEPRVKETAREQYLANMKLLLPFRYMELRGIRYNHTLAKNRCETLKQKLFSLQATFNAMCGYGFSWTSKTEIINRAKEICLTKKQDRERKDYIETYSRVNDLLNFPNPDLATIGEIENLCKMSLNIGGGDLLPFLYETLHLPVQHSTPKDKDKESNPTGNYEAMLNLAKYCQQKNLKDEHKIITAIIELRSLSTRSTNLSCAFDKDERMRFGYNVVGSNTGRTQCYISPTGNGRAGQGIPKYSTPDEAPGGIIGDRDLFLADDGDYLFECDLEGADSWTVAAYSTMLGDSTMLNDLQVGIRPAKRICLKLRGVKIDYNDIHAVLEASKEVSKSSWDYFASKRVVHGGCYLEGARTICRNILKDSEGKLYWSEREGQQAKDLLLKECYPGVIRYHQYIAKKLSVKPILIAASGQVRQFFGRADEILTKAVAFQPQANTTFVANKALWKLWSDYDNRQTSQMEGTNKKKTLIIEPLHQVHDAIIGQFPISKTPWAVEKIRSYFNNPVTIAGQTFVIPFEGGYGTSWGCLKAGEIKP